MPTLRIEIQDKAGRTREERFYESPVRIGRNPRNELCLSFGFVSGWHAIVDFDDRGGAFTDLGSTNGSSMDGQRLAAQHAVAIGPGLTVTIGKLELRFVWEQGEAPVRSVGDAAPSLVPRVATAPLGTDEAPASPRSSYPSAAPSWQEPPRSEPSASVPIPAATPSTGIIDLAGVHQAIRELRPAHAELEAAQRRFQALVDGALDKLPPTTRDTAMAFIRREFPTMPGNSPFAPSPSATPSASEPVVTQFANTVLQEVAAPIRGDDQAAFLARVAALLQTTARAFVEIRNVQARFGEEMGVRTIREYTPLHAAADARGVLDYLLDWRRGGPERDAQLAAVYSDFLLHQVALINGVVGGVEALLEQLDPADVERGVGGLSRAAGAWKKYTERYAEFVEDRGIAALVFGPEFARAYARVGNSGG